MVEYEDDDPTRDEGPIVVRRSVYEAALRFEKTMPTGSIGEAQNRMDRYSEAGNARATARWAAIYKYLMWCASVAAGTKTIILEPGEKYDFENEKVIRRRNRPPRSGKGYR